MVTITIDQGELKGGRSITDSGFEYFEFLGIPYAKPPVGELRFKSPQSPEPWVGVRDATTTNSDTISCQLNPFTGLIKGNEDCLYLNVYTPKLPVSNPELKPVMVFIHGGGFIGGNGTLKDEYGPDYLVEKDVILVTINYRLGLLGFLNLGIPEAAGNMGLKDQVKALQWVQHNIDRFSGDKNNVTIFGSSAGSASCEFLMLSSLSKGLFHKCILHSASVLNSWTINDTKMTTKIVLKLVEKLGYTGSSNDMNGILKVLSNASASDLTGLSLAMVKEETSKKLSIGFAPSIEQDYGNNEAFLTEHPYKMLKEENFSYVPVIKGFCNNEGTLMKAMKPNAIKQLIDTISFVDYWPYAFENNDVEYNSKLKAAYIKNEGVTEEFVMNFFGDLAIAAGVYLSSKLQCKAMPVYMYKFCYDGKLNKFKTLLRLKENGAGHSDEIGYIFHHVGIFPENPSDSDILIRKRLTKMWTNFAKTGNPTPDSNSDLPVQWPQFKEESKEYLNIDTQFTIQADYEPEKMAIFEEIMNKYEQ